jgi:trigger factor
MQVRIEDVSPVEKKLIVEVPWPAVGAKMDQAYRELGKTVALRGFRKGKVPRNVLERMFGRQVRGEVATQLAREAFVAAATEHKLIPVAEPRVESMLDIQSGKPFGFEAIVEVRGDVVAKDYSGMELHRRPMKVEEAAVDAALEQLVREHTGLHPIEEGRDTLTANDVVAVSLKGTLGEHAIDRPQLTFDLGDSSREPLPGLNAALIGKKIDAKDERLTIEIPADHGDPSIAGRTAELTVSVLDARVKDVPAVDDELAKDTGRGETLAELRTALRTDIETRLGEDIHEEVRKHALRELVKRNPIPVAGSLVERAVESTFVRFQRMLGMQPGQGGVDLDDNMRESLRPGALDEVRGQLLLEAVAEQEKLEVDEAALHARVERIARTQNQPAGRLRAEMDRDGRLDNLRFQVRQEKTLDFLIGKANVVEREPEPEPEPAAPSGDPADQPAP